MTRPHVWREGLWNVHEHAEPVDLRHLEQPVRRPGEIRRRRRRVVGGTPSRNQGAHVDVPLENRARERREHALKRCQVDELLDGRAIRFDRGFGGSDGSFSCAERRNVLIDQLDGDRLFGVGSHVPIHRHLRQVAGGSLQIQVLLRLQEIGSGLPQLRIDFRRFNLREELAGLHVVADIHVAPLEIPAGSGVDDGVLNGLSRGRQGEASLGRKPSAG